MKNFLKGNENFWKILEVPSGSEPAAILKDLHATQLAGKILI